MLQIALAWHGTTGLQLVYQTIHPARARACARRGGAGIQLSILRCIFAMSDDTSSHRTVYTKYTRKGETDDGRDFIVYYTGYAHRTHIYGAHGIGEGGASRHPGSRVTPQTRDSCINELRAC